MIKQTISLSIIMVFLIAPLSAQDVTGKWKTIDDETKETKSIVEIEERGGKLYGKIIKVFVEEGENEDPRCDQCSGERANQKIVGMEIIEGLKKEGDVYSGGNIFNPEDGKEYRCKIWLEGNDLKVRGYLGPFYRTQTWKKAS